MRKLTFIFLLALIVGASIVGKMSLRSGAAPIRTFGHHPLDTSHVSRIWYSPGGEQIAIKGSGNSTLTYWDSRTFAQSFNKVGDSALDLDWHHPGNFEETGDGLVWKVTRSGESRLLKDPFSGESLGEYRDTSRVQSETTVSADRRWAIRWLSLEGLPRELANASIPSVLLWDLPNRSIALTLPIKETEPQTIRQGLFSPSGSPLAISLRKQVIQFVDLAAGGVALRESSVTLLSGLHKMRFSKDGKRLLAIENRFLELIDVSRSQVVSNLPVKAPPLTAHFLEDGQGLIVVDALGFQILNLNLQPKGPKQELPQSRNSFFAFGKSVFAYATEKGNMIVTGLPDGKVIWKGDAPKAYSVWTKRRDQDSRISALAISPDESQIAVANWNEVMLLEPKTGKCLGLLGDVRFDKRE